MNTFLKVSGVFILILIIVCVVIYNSLSGFGEAGSYPYVETWEIQANEEEVLKAINELASIDTTFMLTDTNKYFVGRRNGYHNITHLTQEGKEEKYIFKEPHSVFNSYGSEENGWKDYWYHLNFFYSDTKEVVYAWTRPSEDSSTTTLALLGIAKLNNFASYKLINKDYWYFSNKSEINKFNDSIVEKIKLKVQKNTNTDL